MHYKMSTVSFSILFFFYLTICWTKSTLLHSLYFEFDNKQISEVEYKVRQAVDKIWENVSVRLGLVG